MKYKILILLSLALIGCQEEEITPNEPVTENEYCKCGEITNINQYFPDTFFTYTIKNNCTGNDTTATDETYYDYGLDMCLEYTW